MDIFQLTELLGNVGEFVGAIAVVITLIYLAHEVRESSRATKSDTLQRLQEGFTSINALCAKDPQVARLFRLVRTNQTHDLDADERIQASALFTLSFNQYIKAVQAHKTGVINDNQLTLFANDASAWFNTDWGDPKEVTSFHYRMIEEYLRPFIKSNEEMQKISTRPKDWF